MLDSNMARQRRTSTRTCHRPSIGAAHKSSCQATLNSSPRTSHSSSRTPHNSLCRATHKSSCRACHHPSVRTTHKSSCRASHPSARATHRCGMNGILDSSNQATPNPGAAPVAATPNPGRQPNQPTVEPSQSGFGSPHPIILGKAEILNQPQIGATRHRQNHQCLPPAGWKQFMSRGGPKPAVDWGTTSVYPQQPSTGVEVHVGHGP